MRIGVIGGGVIGCSVGWELTRRGHEVHLFEARDVAAGATQASAGALVPYIEAHAAGALRQLTTRSLELYDAFVAELHEDGGGAIDYRRCGSVEVARTSEEADQLRRLAEEPSTPGIRWVVASELRALAGGLAGTVTGGVFVPSHGYVAAEALTGALALAMIRRGGQLHRCAVQRVRAARQRARVCDTSGATHVFDRVVIAVGSWGAALEMDGLPRPPIGPVKGQLLRLRTDGEPIRRILWSSDCYVVPQANGDVLVGATMEEVGFNEEPTGEALRTLLEAFTRLLPGVTSSVVSHRVGLRPTTPDALPIVGPASAAPTLVYSLGHFRNGIVLAPWTALLVADLIDGRRSDPAAALVCPARFGL